MHGEVGVPADRGGEMRIVAQLQPEMSQRLNAVESLRLRAQYCLADDGMHVLVIDAAQNVVEVFWLGRGLHARLEMQRTQELAQLVGLLLCGGLVVSVDEKVSSKFLCNGAVGGGHEFLNEPVGIKTLGRLNVNDFAGFLDANPVFEYFQFQGLSQFARFGQGVIGTPQRFERLIRVIRSKYHWIYRP